MPDLFLQAFDEEITNMPIYEYRCDDCDHQFEALQKMSDMHDLIELLVSWLNEMQTLKSQRLVKLLKLGSGVNKILDLTDRVSGKS